MTTMNSRRSEPFGRFVRRVESAGAGRLLSQNIMKIGHLDLRVLSGIEFR
jgi:hypothetical protein